MTLRSLGERTLPTLYDWPRAHSLCFISPFVNSGKEQLRLHFGVQPPWYMGASTWKGFMPCIWLLVSVSLPKFPIYLVGLLVPTARNSFFIGGGFGVGWNLLLFLAPSPDPSSYHLTRDKHTY